MGNRGSSQSSRNETAGPPAEPIIPSGDHRVVPLELAQSSNPPAGILSGSGSVDGFLSPSEIGGPGTLQPIQPNPILLTPRREDHLYNKISHTPIGDQQVSIYKYYCPLCMSFYQDILVCSSCCRHYICSECSADYLLKRNCQVNSLNEILAGTPYQHLPCPHCNSSGFSPALVAPQDEIRSYLDSASPPLNCYPSPMKIGDSFEDMKRKMGAVGQSQQRSDPSSSSSKPLLPPSATFTASEGNRVRQFSPEAEMTRLIDPLPFPSLDSRSSAAPSEQPSNPPSHRSLHSSDELVAASAPETPLSATPLRGIALNPTRSSNDNSSAPASASSQTVPSQAKQETLQHAIASNFVFHLIRSNTSGVPEPLSGQQPQPQPQLQWISALFPSPASLLRRNSRGNSSSPRVAPAPAEDLLIPCRRSSSRSSSPSPRGRPSLSPPEREIHDFAAVFVNTILPVPSPLPQQ
jgi:hypothetical protein